MNSPSLVSAAGLPSAESTNTAPPATGVRAAAAARAPMPHAWRATRAARTVLGLLGRLQHGSLELQAPWGTQTFRAEGAAAVDARMQLRGAAVFERVLKSGDIGLAEAYVDGQWTSPDLPRLLALFMRNRESLERVVYGNALGTLAYRLTHWLRRNTRRGSRRNIEAHYDLGNDFYTAWLDPTMNYSSAWFDGDAAMSLPEAQHRKVRRALDEAGVGPGSRVLEIGCGWGAVAEAAVLRDARITGVTLSHEQLAYAQQRIARLGRSVGPGAQADLRLQDYRDLAAEVQASGRRYDAIVSIEMFEAVGRAFWPGYFDTLRRCLAEGGRACVQVITIRDDLFERYVRGTDFIQQYVFPGGLLPGAGVFRAAAAEGGLEVVNELAFGTDYARTLAHWREAFHAERAHIAQLGYDERFMRLWDFYLAYCEAAFATGQTDVRQFTLQHRGGAAR
jgi:cyclopropane-fatty-acyl-phospholipid synthase